MQDKDMVNDVISQINSSLTGYANVIAQSSNPQLRQALTDIRNSDEMFQFKLSQKAIEKGYYKPAPPANPQEVQQIKSMFQGGMS